MKLLNSIRLWLGLLTVVPLTFTAFPQSTNRIVQWPANISTPLNTNGAGSSKVLAKIDALEMVDIAVSGKSITIGQSFAGDDEWLKNLTVRVRNVSSLNISSAQLNLFLPEIMPGGPQVTLCYGCGDVGKGQSIAPAEEVEMKIVFYSWLVGQVNAKSSFSKITKAEIQNVIVKLPDGTSWLSTCLRTSDLKNACPTPAP